MTKIRASNHRTRISATMPTWLHDDASRYGAKLGFGMSELITRELERFVETQKALENPVVPAAPPVIEPFKRRRR